MTWHAWLQGLGGELGQTMTSGSWFMLILKLIVSVFLDGAVVVVVVVVGFVVCFFVRWCFCCGCCCCGFCCFCVSLFVFCFLCCCCCWCCCLCCMDGGELRPWKRLGIKRKEGKFHVSSLALPHQNKMYELRMWISNREEQRKPPEKRDCTERCIPESGRPTVRHMSHCIFSVTAVMASMWPLLATPSSASMTPHDIITHHTTAHDITTAERLKAGWRTQCDTSTPKLKWPVWHYHAQIAVLASTLSNLLSNKHTRYEWSTCLGSSWPVWVRAVFGKYPVLEISSAGSLAVVFLGRENNPWSGPACLDTPPLAKVQGGGGGLKYNTGFVFFYLWISPSIHIHIYMYIYMYIFFGIIFIQYIHNILHIYIEIYWNILIL